MIIDELQTYKINILPELLNIYTTSQRKNYSDERNCSIELLQSLLDKLLMSNPNAIGNNFLLTLGDLYFSSGNFSKALKTLDYIKDLYQQALFLDKWILILNYCGKKGLKSSWNQLLQLKNSINVDNIHNFRFSNTLEKRQDSYIPINLLNTYIQSETDINEEMVFYLFDYCKFCKLEEINENCLDKAIHFVKIFTENPIFVSQLYEIKSDYHRKIKQNYGEALVYIEKSVEMLYKGTSFPNEQLLLKVKKLSKILLKMRNPKFLNSFSELMRGLIASNEESRIVMKNLKMLQNYFQITLQFSNEKKVKKERKAMKKRFSSLIRK